MRGGGKSAAVRAASNGAFRGGVRGGVAIECARRSDGQLQRGAHFCLGWCQGKILATALGRRGRIGAGLWIDEFLSFAGSVRTNLGEYRAGAFVGPASIGKLSLHADRRSGAQRLQLDRVERGGSADGNDRNRGDCSAPEGSEGGRKRRATGTVARAAVAFRGGDDFDASAKFFFLGASSEAAIRAVSVALDGDSRRALRVFSCGWDSAAPKGMDLGRAGGDRYRWNGYSAGSESLVGFRGHPGFAGSDCARPGL